MAYDVDKAFKRIENELIDSMIRNFKHHRVEEGVRGMDWAQWQVVQLKELERYRLDNPAKFADDFHDINKRVDGLLRTTYTDANTAEEAKILEQIKKGKIKTSRKGAVNAGFFGVNESRLNHLIDATQADFARGEWSILRQANDQFRKTIFDAQVYATAGATYEQAVDMATKDFLRKGIQNITYKNGARHTMADYASMALRTGQKRAYLMGEGDAHDKYGIHTVRVNKRVDACPLCVKWLGKVLVDDVYSGGTLKEANELGVPTLSEAIDAGFLHPNCKDIYTLYIEGVSKPAEPWTREEMEQIAKGYNEEQAIKRAEDMRDSYDRMARNSLDPANQQRYQARADIWGDRLETLKGAPPVPVTPPTPPATEPPVSIAPFTDSEKEAIEWYVSGDGMWINQYLRGRGEFGELSDNEKMLLDALKTATDRPLEEGVDVLYRSVDSRAIFGDLPLGDRFDIGDFLMYGDSAVPKDKIADIQKTLEGAKGKTITEKGFMSTTTDLDLAVDFDGFTGAEHSVVLELETKGAKVRGANLKEFEVAEDPQKEILLAPNVKYKIKDITVEQSPENGKFIKVRAEIVDEATASVAEVAEVAETAEVVAEETATAFVPATTVQEADAYAKGIGIDAYYKGVDLDVANAMNEAFTRGLEYAPQIKDRLQMTGSGQTQNRMLKDAITQHILKTNPMVQRMRAQGYDEAYLEKLAKKSASKSVGRISGDTWAYARNANPPFEGFRGIFVNSKWTFEQMSKDAKEMVKIGFHPIGCDTIKSIFDHEVGHLLDYAFGLRKDPEVLKLWNAYTKAQIKTELSGYGSESVAEFIAEAYSEYLNNPNPRKIAQEIGRIIESKVKQQ